MWHRLNVLGHHIRLLLIRSFTAPFINLPIHRSCKLWYWLRNRDRLSDFVGGCLNLRGLILEKTIQRGNWRIFPRDGLHWSFFLYEIRRMATCLSQKALTDILCWVHLGITQCLIPLVGLSVSAASTFWDKCYVTLLLIHLDQLMKVYSLISKRIILLFDPCSLHKVFFWLFLSCLFFIIYNVKNLLCERPS